MYQSEQINELASALSKAQGEITPAIKDSTNPFFKSKYADLASIWDACKTALSKHGLAVLQTMDYRENQMVLITTLAHASGQWVRSTLPILPTKNDAQGIGSAITYMRRYSLAAIVGVTTDEDDDGNAACANGANGSKSVGHSPTKAVATITKPQAEELDYLLKGCDPSYQTQFWGFLKKEVSNIQSLDQLPSSMYARIKAGIDKKYQENNAHEEAYA